MQRNRYKVVVVGDSGVGKSSVLNRLVRQKFDYGQESTIGAAFWTHSYHIPTTNQICVFEIWDTAGQERYRALVPMYFRGSSVLLLAFDGTCLQSLENIINTWVPYAKQHLDGREVVTVLLETKADHPSSGGLTSRAQSYAREQGFLFAKTSSLTGEGIKEMVECIAGSLCKENVPTITQLGFRPESKTPPPPPKSWSESLMGWWNLKCTIL